MNEMKKYTKKLKRKLNKKKIKMEKIDIMELKKIRNRARLITDTRIKKKSTYKIWDIVCVVLIATLCNCNDWEEIHFKNTIQNILNSSILFVKKQL